MAFLNIVTRHRPERAHSLELTKHSIAMQTDDDCSHIIVVDDMPNRDWQRAHDMLIDAIADIDGDYVLILDDDDMLINSEAVEMLKDATLTDPGVVIWKAWHHKLGILPDSQTWGKRPQIGHIGACGFVLRSDVYESVLLDMQADGYKGRYANDFDIINRAWDESDGHVWINELMTWATGRGGV